MGVDWGERVVCARAIFVLVLRVSMGAPRGLARTTAILNPFSEAASGPPPVALERALDGLGAGAVLASGAQGSRAPLGHQAVHEGSARTSKAFGRAMRAAWR